MTSWTSSDASTGVLSLLACVLGIIEVALQAIALSHLPQKGNDVQWPPNGPPPKNTRHWFLSLIPAHLSTESNNAIMACGALSIATGVVCTFRILATQSKGNSAKHGYLWSLATCTFSALTSFTTLVIFIYAFVKEYRSTEWHYTNYLSSSGHFTLESWACQMDPRISESYDTFHVSCTTAVRWSIRPVHVARTIADTLQRGGRWLIIPLLLVLASLTGFSLFDLRERQSRVGQEERDREKAKLPQ